MSGDTHMMLDLETLGVGARAVIMEVGAVVFDPLADSLPTEPPVPDTFYQAVDIQSCLTLGMEVDASTILWWFEQADVNRLRITEAAKKNLTLPMHGILDKLTAFIMAHNVKWVWAHGATFDPVVLSEAYRRMKRNIPYSFRDVRDTRTLYAMSDLTEAEWKILLENPKKHHPVYDAWTHAKAVHYCLLGEDEKGETNDASSNDDHSGARAVGQ